MCVCVLPFSVSLFVVVILLRFAYTFAWLKTPFGEAFLFLVVFALVCFRWCHVCVFVSFLLPFHFSWLCFHGVLLILSLV